MDTMLEWRIWRQLRGAFRISQFNMCPVVCDAPRTNRVRQFDNMVDALAASSGERVFLEATGFKTVAEIPREPVDIVLVLGNTNNNNLAYAQPWELYRINQTGRGTMYGMDAAAIALAYRVGQ